MMLTKNKNPKVSYYSRLLVLPLAAIVFFAFTIKVKNEKPLNLYDGKTLTVVIDAGHGGDDNGAHSANGLKEKDITLSIAKKIAALNSNDHIQILLSRNNDQFISVRDRVHFAKKHDADLFVSVHLNGAVDEQLNGFSVMIDRNNTEKNQVLASALINELKVTYKTDNEIEVRNRGLFVVDSNSCPAALVECGYITNPNDVAFISEDAIQEKIAKNILAAINNYASALNSNTTANETLQSDKNDTIPYAIYYKGKKLKSTEYVDSTKVEATYSDGSKETITKAEALKRGFIPPPSPVISDKKIVHAMFVDTRNKVAIYADKIVNTTLPEKTNVNVMKAVIIINDKIEPNSILKTKTIHAGTLTIHSGDEKDMIAKYGEKARNGVFVLDNAVIKNETPIFPEGGKPSKPGDIIFTKVNVDAQFPGGPQAWQKYIVRKIQASIDTFTKADYGTCVVRFIVNTDGKVSNVQATTMKGTLLAKISINAIKDGPKWIPASQNGHTVASYRLQPVTLTNPNAAPKNATGNTSGDDKKIFIKLEQQASFPGGKSAWLRYINRVFQKNGNQLMENKNNEGTCQVRFIVNIDGSVSDVQPITMKGTQLAEVAVNAIKKGPEWIPGKQNGHIVNSYVTVPVTFKLSDNIMIKNEPE